MKMRLGMVVRNMGPASSREIFTECAQYVESVGLDDVWVTDHIAIPRAESEGSGGRYLDPLAALAYLSGVTERVGLGVGVLVVPYRPALPTAKWLATIQELSGGRLIFGAGVGWMTAEFAATGVDRTRRGAITDETLAFINECFDNDDVVSNGQDFVFAPRPTKPPILIGGTADYAFDRIVASGDGWMPARLEPEALAPLVEQLRECMAAAGKASPEVAVLTHLPVEDAGAAAGRIAAYTEAGATSIAHFSRYESSGGLKSAADTLASLRV
jgi:probable F420-dependent oxidoreductase